MYRVIHETFWTDRDNKRLGADARYLFLTLITARQTHFSGLYYLGVGDMCRETGMPECRVRDALAELDKKQVKYDEENELVFVVKAILYQGCGQNKTRNVRSHLKTIHSCHLKDLFLQLYPEYLAQPRTASHNHAQPRTDKNTGVRDCAEVCVSGTVTVTEVPPLTPPIGEGVRRPKKPKLPLLKNREELASAINEIELESFKTQYEPDGLDVLACFEAMKAYVLDGSASKPYPNPSKWRDFRKALHDACRRANEQGRFRLRDPTPPTTCQSTKYVTAPPGWE